MISNCISCGAPIESDKKKCHYCGTLYDVHGFSSQIKGCTGTINVSGKTYEVYIGNVEFQDIISSFRNSRSMLETKTKTKRKFTLIEI